MTGQIMMLFKRGYALVSREDYPALSELTWTVYRSSRCRYLMTRIPRRGGYERIAMHRLITGAAPGTVVDHIDHDGLNNTRENLRIATWAQNSHNSRPRLGARFKGVLRDGTGWKAKCQGKHLGIYATEEEAAAAYNIAAIERYGAFAWLNPVGDISPTKRPRPERPVAPKPERRRVQFKGYSWHSGQQRFIAAFKGKFLGYFETAESAHAAYVEAKETGVIKRKARVTVGRRNKSGFRGVSWSKCNARWVATIRHAGTGRHLGLFYNKREAARAYDAAAIKIHGKRAILNFPSYQKG